MLASHSSLPRWWERPADMEAIGEPMVLTEVVAAVRPPCQRYRRVVDLVQPGAYLHLTETTAVLVDPLPDYVHFSDPPSFGARTVHLEDAVAVIDGEFHTARGGLPTDSLRPDVDALWLLNNVTTRSPKRLPDGEAWAVLGRMLPEQLETFAGSADARAAVEALALRQVRGALERLSPLQLAERLCDLAEAGAVVGWTPRMLAGGILTFLELLERELAKRPAPGILDLVAKVRA